MNDTDKPAFAGTSEAFCSASDAAQEVVYWAKAVLTALNTGNIEKDSLLHHKLREVVIKHRDAVERETPNAGAEARSARAGEDA